jgi:hypothetical protein
MPVFHPSQGKQHAQLAKKTAAAGTSCIDSGRIVFCDDFPLIQKIKTENLYFP